MSQSEDELGSIIMGSCVSVMLDGNGEYEQVVENGLEIACMDVKTTKDPFLQFVDDSILNVNKDQDCCKVVCFQVACIKAFFDMEWLGIEDSLPLEFSFIIKERNNQDEWIDMKKDQNHFICSGCPTNQIANLKQQVEMRFTFLSTGQFVINGILRYLPTLSIRLEEDRKSECVDAKCLSLRLDVISG